VLFYVLLLALPLAGYIANSLTGRTIDFFGLFTIPALPTGENKELGGAIFDLHATTGKVLLALIALHVLGALKHTFVDRDGGIFRMLPFGRVKPAGE
jgi:cytochrome b561